MQNKKMKIEDLKIASFVTSVKQQDINNIKGGLIGPESDIIELCTDPGTCNPFPKKDKR